MSKLAKNTLIISSMTLISRMLGLLRDVILLGTFGASAPYDAFLVAFKIPNFMRRLSAEGAFSQAFVPVLADQAELGQGELKRFINSMAGLWGLVLLLIVALGIMLATGMIRFFAPGFELGGERFTLAIQMLGVTFPYVFFISMTAFFGGVLNIFNRFAVPALGPVLLNVALIVSALILAPKLSVPVHALAWGVLLAGIAQFIFPLIFMVPLGCLPKPTFYPIHPGVKQVLKLMIPALLGASVVQLDLVIDNIFASFLPVGSVSWLYAADRLMQFPLGVFGIALATAILPSLSRSIARNDERQYRATLDEAIKGVCIIALPASIGLLLLAKPLTLVLFGHGAFSLADVERTAPCMQALVAGLFFFIMIKILANAFYARKQIKIAAHIGVVALLVNLLGNSIFIGPWRHVGLAAATSMSAVVNAALLFWMLKKRGHYELFDDAPFFMAKVALCNATMVLMVWSLNPPLEVWMRWSFALQSAHLALCVLSGIAVYFLSIWWFKLVPTSMLARLAR